MGLVLVVRFPAWNCLNHEEDFLTESDDPFWPWIFSIVQMKNIVYAESKEGRYFHSQFQRRIIFVIFYGNDRLPGNTKLFRQVFLPQFSVFSEFFDIILHRPLSRQSYGWSHTA